jgi:hypothetical protein
MPSSKGVSFISGSADGAGGGAVLLVARLACTRTLKVGSMRYVNMRRRLDEWVESEAAKLMTT